MSKPLLRQRSRDLKTHSQEAVVGDEAKEHVSETRVVQRGWLNNAIIVTLLILVTAGVLSSKWYFQGDSSNVEVLSQDSEPSEDHHGFDLHPQKHIYRAPTTINRTWTITSHLRRPDGVLKQIYLVNNAFPGPILEARSGDRIVVHVVNALHDEGISIHWHGLEMRAANSMDGAVGVTQRAIEPGSSFTYDFSIGDEEHGTFWYHAHDGVQRADGLYGGFVVHRPADEGVADDLNHEQLLLIGDWYHRPGQEAHEYFSHPGSFGNEPVPDSILLQGKGVYNCTHAVPARPVDCQFRDVENPPVPILRRSPKTMLRVVNVGSYAGIDLSVENALLRPVAVDGDNLVRSQPASKVGYLYPGERVDLIVEPTGASDETLLNVSFDQEPFKYDNLALTANHQFRMKWHGNVQSSPSYANERGSLVDLTQLESLSSHTVPPHAQETVVLYTTTQKLARLENKPLGFINHTTWSPMSEPLRSLPRSSWDNNQLVPHLPLSSTIDIILNNLDEEPHPFHLHGFSFYVLSTYSSDYNWGSYNPYEDADPPGGSYNLLNPVKKDTVVVPRRGYAVLRFETGDNVGIWMFHCHVLWHQAAGMAMAFDVS